MKPNQIIPYFAVTSPFDIVYRNNSTSFPVKPHTHNALEIYFTLTDLPDVLLNDTVSSVKAGSLILIPPYNIHQLFNQKLTIYERYIVTINSSWLETVLGDSSSSLMPYASSQSQPTIITLSSAKSSDLSRRIGTYIQESKAPSISAYADFFSLLEYIDSLISEDFAKKGIKKLSISKAQKNVNEIIEYINDNLCKPLTLESIAANFHLNKDYLARLFKEHTQATIGHYISVQRASLAQNMLSSGHTVSEVQEALGFTSYAYFFKFFKKMTGISPSQYRKM